MSEKKYKLKNNAPADFQFYVTRTDPSLQFLFKEEVTHPWLLMLHSYPKLTTQFCIKEQYRNHKTSFRHEKEIIKVETDETELFKHTWVLKGENKLFHGGRYS